MNRQQYIVVVEGFKESWIDHLARLRKEHPKFSSAIFLNLTTQPSTISRDEDVIYEHTDFSSDSLSSIMEKYRSNVVAVICRGDTYVQYLRKLLPFLPNTIPVATDSALRAATNKRLMREAFLEYAPEITPKFVKVSDNGRERALQTVAREFNFPVIIKPASLASSLLIQKCADMTELTSALSNVAEKIQEIYTREKRIGAPEVIIEEFLVGDFYSIDSHVMGGGSVYHTPIVGYLPADSMGVDDFYLYKRWLPTALSSYDEDEARQTVEKAIKAVGLTASSVHAELVKTAAGWRIIEIGPRLGRFRDAMYRSGCGIDHGYNDLLLHLGITPDTTPRYAGGAIAYSIYPESEGVLEGLIGIDGLRQYEDVIVDRNIKQDIVGRFVYYAKNGGSSLAEFVFASKDRARLEEASRYFEQQVRAVVRAPFPGQTKG